VVKRVVKGVVVDDVMGRVVARSPTQRMIAEIDTSRFTSDLDLNRGVSILAIMARCRPLTGVGRRATHPQPTTPTRLPDAYFDLEVAPPGGPGPAGSLPRAGTFMITKSDRPTTASG